jgi:predicted GNAT family N-acyltransferase
MYFSILQFATPEYDEMVQLRTDILRKPLNMTFETEFLAREWQDTHLAAYSEADELLGGLLLTQITETSVQMRQVAIAERQQNQGIGTQLVAFAENYAVKKGFSRMYLHARDTAVAFYVQQNYTIIGKPFLEIGIGHVEMEKEIINIK